MNQFLAPTSFENLSVRLANDSDAPELRQMVNAAYKELADMGLNYTGTYQGEAMTPIVFAPDEHSCSMTTRLSSEPSA